MNDIEKAAQAFGKELRKHTIVNLQEMQESSVESLGSFTNLINEHYRDKDSFIEKYGQSPYDEYADILSCHIDLLQSIISEAPGFIDALLDNYSADSFADLVEWRRNKTELYNKSEERIEKLYQQAGRL